MEEAFGCGENGPHPDSRANPQRIGWTSRHKDLATYDEISVRLFADQKFWEIANKYTDSFVPGSVHDEIWRTL